MNLELLSPFRRQIPDRVDATLTLPNHFHHKKGTAAGTEAAADGSPEKKQEESPEDQEWKAAYHVAFNRRGTYLAVGHASGTVAVHDFLSRTLSALYRPDDTEQAPDGQVSVEYPNGVTSVTWSRRSRALLAGALGDAHVRLIDTTHPMGPEECVSLPPEAEGVSADLQAATHDALNVMVLGTPLDDTSNKTKYEIMKSTRSLDTLNLTEGYLDAEPPSTVRWQKLHEEALQKLKEGKSDVELGVPDDRLMKRYPILSFSLPHPVGGSLQIHPRDVTAGLAVLNNGSLIIFRAPPDGWESYPQIETSPLVKLSTLWEGSMHSITCAAFDPHGDKVYAATKDGILMCFKVKKLFDFLKAEYDTMSVAKPFFRVDIPGGATAWHLLVSRNGRFILLNCADSALRVYDAKECEASSSLNALKPKVFQDVVSKVPFASCDFSGDAEYLVGGCNANDKYDLYVWNATTGALMDRLTGPQVSLYSVAWHPTRSFLAVATSDGVVDIWGPRMDWTSFAPDFQALPMNVEYIEEEDEFDIVDNKDEESQAEEDVEVDVVTVEPVPVFASDSESESEVFSFETKISNIMDGRGRNMASVGWAGRGGGEEKD
jgi:WD40 repeat protein